MIATSETANAREKYETESKNQLKKLQKFREQIKGWLSNSDVKDTTVLEKTKRDIEIRMEGYKAHEKEAKTKAFSKEGLQAAASKVDPLEQAKQEERDWLNGTVETLSSQIEEMEAEMEEISGGKSRKKSKPTARFTTLETSVGRHQEHVLRLEKMLRLLENDVISVEDVQDVRDFVDDYIDRCMEDPDEFENVDDIYGDLVDVMDAQQDTTVNHLSAKEKEKEKEKEEKERERQKAAAAAAKGAARGAGNRSAGERGGQRKGEESGCGRGDAGQDSVSGGQKGLGCRRHEQIRGAAPAASAQGRGLVQSDQPGGGQPGGPRNAGPCVCGGGKRGQDGRIGPVSCARRRQGCARRGGWRRWELELGVGGGVGSQSPGMAPPPAVDPTRDMLSMPIVDEARLDSGLDQMKMLIEKMKLQDGIAEKDYPIQQRLQLLQVSAPRSIPQLSDSRWSLLNQRPTPSNMPIPPSYPSQKLALLAAPELFNRLDPETLLYSFSFEKGTLQQFLASRSLSAKGWMWDDSVWAVWRGRVGPGGMASCVVASEVCTVNGRL